LALVKYVVFHPWRASTVLVVGVIVGLGSFYAYQVNAALGAVAVEEFDPDSARKAIEATPQLPVESPPSSAAHPFDGSAYDIEKELAAIAANVADIPEEDSFNTAAFGEPLDDAIFDAYLLIGTDASGYLADTIILALQPGRGGAPIMVSLPRDSTVEHQQGAYPPEHRSWWLFGVASGSELLAIMAEDYTGIPIDHLARVDFDGFARIVDVMGGITICVDNPTRDAKSHLLIESTGCQTRNGATALAWVRSRHPEELAGNGWVPVGGSDFGRQERQQDVLFQLAARAAGFSSPGSLTDKLSAVASSVRLDSSWTFGSAVGAAWRYRGISKEDVKRFSIETSNYRTSSVRGASAYQAVQGPALRAL
jgi:LCP family protein required for cell wall assembly